MRAAIFISLVMLASSACAGAGGSSLQGLPSPDAGTASPLRPGDRLAVKVWSDSTVRDTFVVSTRGELALPKIGIFQVASMGAGELQDSVKRAYTALVQDPAVQVAALRRVGVVGEVREPGIYFSDLTMTIADVIALAGGLTQSGDSRRVSIRRESQVFPLDMRSGIGAVAAIESGDQIVVGLRGFWARNPGLLVSTATGLFYFIISRL